MTAERKTRAIAILTRHREIVIKTTDWNYDCVSGELQFMCHDDYGCLQSAISTWAEHSKTDDRLFLPNWVNDESSMAQFSSMVAKTLGSSTHE